eukprot:gene35693-44018_t
MWPRSSCTMSRGRGSSISFFTTKRPGLLLMTYTSGVAVHCELERVSLRPSAELVVYRLVQEAITNIAKYAQARNVWIALGMRDGQVEVSVRDDGVGFDTSIKPSSAYGLVGMRFRVKAEGGNLQLQSQPGQGTLIHARLPEQAAITP